MLKMAVISGSLDPESHQLSGHFVATRVCRLPTVISRSPRRERRNSLDIRSW